MFSGSPESVKRYKTMEVALGHQGELKMRMVNPTNAYSIPPVFLYIEIKLKQIITHIMMCIKLKMPFKTAMSNAMIGFLYKEMINDYHVKNLYIFFVEKKDDFVIFNRFKSRPDQ